MIPPPDEVINGRRYWYEQTLDEADRKRTIEAAAELGKSNQKDRAPETVA